MSTLTLTRREFKLPSNKSAGTGRRKPTDNHQIKSHNRNEEIFNIILIISLLNLLIYFISVSFIKYDLSADELYYLACANRLDFGYVDHPPLSVWILSFWKFLCGDSIFVIRILPAIISSATVVLIGLFTVKLGGGKNSVIIATITFMLLPVFLGASTIYSLNIFDFFFWILSSYIYLVIIQSEKSKLWFVLGGVIGLGLLNSTTIIWLITGIIIGTVFTPVREDLKTKYPYIAAGIALLIFSPYIIWNLTNNFVHIDFIREAASRNYGSLSPVSYLLDLLLILNPLSVLIWVPGLLFYFYNRNSGPYSAFGYIWLVTIAVLFLNWHSKAEYVAPSFQILFAGGAIMIVKWNAKLNRIKYALVTPVVVLGMLLAPLAHPFLPLSNFIDYQSWVNLKAPVNEENGKELLPRYSAGMIGWNDLANKVSEVYLFIPDDIRRNTLVYCSNYGEAGAFEYYRDKYELPGVICPQNSYSNWWSEKRNPSTIIFIGGSIGEYLDYFETVEVGGFYKSKHGIPYRNNTTIFICRGFKGALEKIRRRDKTFI